MTRNSYPDQKSRKKYKYPEYHPLYKSKLPLSQMVEEMNLDQLWKELKELCDIED